MYIKLLISCFLVTFIIGCNSEEKLKTGITNKVSITKQKYNECLAYGKIVGDNLSPENANKLMTFITPKGILNSYKNNVFWFDVVTGKGLLEYYFFYDSECEKRVENTQLIMTKYFLSTSEFSGLTVEVKPISETDLPSYLARPVGRWLDK